MSAFIDEVEIFVKAGDGGAGSATFRTEKHVPRGGPDGGDGGRGGSVVFRTDSNLSTLLELRPGKHYKAARGGIGQSRRMFGKDGTDLVIDVPPGTQVRDAETGELLADLTRYPQEETIAAGGRGGRGNVHFVSSTHQAPRFAEKGEPGEERRVKVELKLLADVGLLGFPNVGKSTLLARVSAARPKIADYPFTTLVPNLGVVRIDESHHFVMADIPGLIENASEGAGLGIQFLRHLERTRLLVHLVDASGLSGRDPSSDFDVINKELAAFSAPLASLEQVLALSRIDAQPDRDAIDALVAHFRGLGLTVFPISAVTGEGVEALVYHVHQRLQTLPKGVAAPIEGSVVYLSARDLKAEEDPRRFTIERDLADDAVLIVKGRGLERAVAMTDMESEDAVRRLQRRMERWGVFRKLKAFGAQDGETVRIGKVEFDYTDDDLDDDA